MGLVVCLHGLGLSKCVWICWGIRSRINFVPVPVILWVLKQVHFQSSAWTASPNQPLWFSTKQEVMQVPNVQWVSFAVWFGRDCGYGTWWRIGLSGESYPKCKWRQRSLRLAMWYWRVGVGKVRQPPSQIWNWPGVPEGLYRALCRSSG